MNAVVLSGRPRFYFPGIHFSLLFFADQIDYGDFRRSENAYGRPPGACAPADVQEFIARQGMQTVNSWKIEFHDKPEGKKLTAVSVAGKL